MKSIDFYKPLLTGFKLIYSIAIVTCHVAPLSQHLVMNAGPIMISLCHLDLHLNLFIHVDTSQIMLN